MDLSKILHPHKSGQSVAADEKERDSRPGHLRDRLDGTSRSVVNARQTDRPFSRDEITSGADRLQGKSASSSQGATDIFRTSHHPATSQVDVGQVRLRTSHHSFHEDPEAEPVYAPEAHDESGSSDRYDRHYNHSRPQDRHALDQRHPDTKSYRAGGIDGITGEPRQYGRYNERSIRQPIDHGPTHPGSAFDMASAPPSTTRTTSRPIEGGKGKERMNEHSAGYSSDGSDKLRDYVSAGRLHDHRASMDRHYDSSGQRAPRYTLSAVYTSSAPKLVDERWSRAGVEYRLDPGEARIGAREYKDMGPIRDVPSRNLSPMSMMSMDNETDAPRCSPPSGNSQLPLSQDTAPSSYPSQESYTFRSILGPTNLGKSILPEGTGSFGVLKVAEHPRTAPSAREVRGDRFRDSTAADYERPSPSYYKARIHEYGDNIASSSRSSEDAVQRNRSAPLMSSLSLTSRPGSLRRGMAGSRNMFVNERVDEGAPDYVLDYERASTSSPPHSSPYGTTSSISPEPVHDMNKKPRKRKHRPNFTSQTERRLAFTGDHWISASPGNYAECKACGKRVKTDDRRCETQFYSSLWEKHRAKCKHIRLKYVVHCWVHRDELGAWPPPSDQYWNAIRPGKPAFPRHSTPSNPLPKWLELGRGAARATYNLRYRGMKAYWDNVLLEIENVFVGGKYNPRWHVERGVEGLDGDHVDDFTEY